MKREAIRTLTAVLVAAIPAVASASDARVEGALQAETQRTDALSVSHGQTAVQTRIASEFSAFAGSDSNARSLVAGLRNGAPITLNAASASSGSATSTTSTTIDPGTRPMGYGNVFIGLALARQQLAGYGISDPTPLEIRAALTGGTITTAGGETVALKGVLTQRASGQGWGAIARSQGASLGQVVGSLKSANQHVTVSATTTRGVSSEVVAGSQPSSVSTTLHGHDAGNASAFGHGRGGIGSGASGVVNAGGAESGVHAGVGAGARAQGAGAGVVTGAGVGVSARGGVSPGLGKGLSKP